MFLPAVVCRCLLTTHDAANERCFLRLGGGGDLYVSLSQKYVFTWGNMFYFQPVERVKQFINFFCTWKYKTPWKDCQTSYVHILVFWVFFLILLITPSSVTGYFMHLAWELLLVWLRSGLKNVFMLLGWGRGAIMLNRLPLIVPVF